MIELNEDQVASKLNLGWFVCFAVPRISHKDADVIGLDWSPTSCIFRGQRQSVLASDGGNIRAQIRCNGSSASS